MGGGLESGLEGVDYVAMGLPEKEPDEPVSPVSSAKRVSLAVRQSTRHTLTHGSRDAEGYLAEYVNGLAAVRTDPLKPRAAAEKTQCRPAR